ncbi:MAG: serine/threonine protein kinase [Planctomycetes bacterium]|nr:serine/threonine protein kinase [Planctomycetota bacterium]
MSARGQEALDWALLEAAFEEARRLDPEQRAAFVARLGAGDRRFHDELSSLLAAAERGDARLDEPLAGDAGRVVRTLAGLETGPVGTTIDGNRVEGVVATGGMGTVYLALRDGDPNRPVALKLLHARVATDDLLARFRAESEVLASLEHPNIARFEGSGETADGRPYYLMELIDGRPITEHCDESCLDVPARIALFAKVCDAVAHAHRNLVVHRDLKPANVLVDRRGEPHLVDFGIAKVLRGTDTRDPQTQIMTPEYSSPEQARGARVSTATDVYSLGVMLHELLTGRLPCLRDGEPQRASVSLGRLRSEELAAVAAARQTTVTRLAKALRGDLDRLLECALAEDPSRRPATAERFADDLRRHLRGETISARGNHLAYRISKFVRRHRASLAASAAVLIALGLGLIVASWQARVARAEAARALAVTNLLVDVLGTAAPDPQTGALPRSFVDRARESVAQRPGLDPNSRGTLLAAIARLYHRIGAYDAAQALFAESIPLLARGGAANERTVLTAGTLAAFNHIIAGDFDAAERSLLELRPRAESLGDQGILGEIAAGLAEILRQRGDFEGAIEMATRAFELRSATGTATVRELVIACNRISAANYALRRYAESERACLEALRLVDTNPGMEPAVRARVLHNLGCVDLRLHRFEAADARLTEGLLLREASFVDGHPDVAESLHALGLLRLESGAFAAAEALFAREVELRERLTPRHWFVDDARSRLGDALLRQGRVDDAQPLLEASHARLVEEIGADHEHTIEAAERLDRMRAARGR